MKVRVRGIYHLPRNAGYGGIDGHDVVVLKVYRRKKGFVKVASLTSLERYSQKHKSMRYDLAALAQAKAGELDPVPIDELGSRHWSGIDHRYAVVEEDRLVPRKIMKKDRIKCRFVR